MPCEICLDPLVVDLSVLPCGHVFHSNCVRQLSEHRNKCCPKCRHPSITALKLMFSFDEADEADILILSPAPKKKSKPPKPVNEDMESLQFHIGNLESRLEFLLDRNEELKMENEALNESVAEMNGEMERHLCRVEDLEDSLEALRRELRLADRHKQALQDELAALQEELKLERKSNEDLRNLRIAESTLKLCRQLEQLDESELSGFGAGELRRRLAAMTLVAQGERRDGEQVREELRKMMIRLERAEKALARGSVKGESDKGESIGDAQVEHTPQTPIFSATSVIPVNPFKKPLTPKISNVMVPAKVLKPPKKSASTTNAFGVPGKVIRFADGKGHFI